MSELERIVPSTEAIEAVLKIYPKNGKIDNWINGILVTAYAIDFAAHQQAMQAAQEEIARLQDDAQRGWIKFRKSREDYLEVEQILGDALGYSETGEHVAITLAQEASKQIARLRELLQEFNAGGVSADRILKALDYESYKQRAQALEARVRELEREVLEEREQRHIDFQRAERLQGEVERLKRQKQIDNALPGEF